MIPCQFSVQAGLSNLKFIFERSVHLEQYDIFIFLFLVDVAMLWSFTVVNSLPVEAWALNSLVLLLIFWLLKDFQARISKL